MDARRRPLLLLAASVAARPALAQHGAYPSRPVRVLLGFPPGGTADIVTRLVCEALQARLGQPFVVENRPGAATNLATEAAVRAPPDGYTLLATTTSNLLNGALFPALPFDFQRDIAPVASLTTQPLVLVAGPALPLRDPAGLVAAARADPGRITIGNFGLGTVSHLAAELFRQAAGIELVTVPYRGAPPMLADLLAGRIQVAFDNIPTSLEHIRAGRLRALAVTGATRAPSLPEVPPMADTIPGYEASSVAGLGAPRGTPPALVATLNAAAGAALADPAVSGRLVAMGATPRIGPPEAFAGLIAEETAKWTRVIRAAGIRIE
jgi:tripartite-type tricarboxylate transporter receptor subunit TctC